MITHMAAETKKCVSKRNANVINKGFDVKVALLYLELESNVIALLILTELSLTPNIKSKIPQSC